MRSIRMWCGALLAALTVAGKAQAWRPAGWVYVDWPWAYDSTSGDWQWFSADGSQWIHAYSPGTGWALMQQSVIAHGWSYWNEAWAYDGETGAWCWRNTADTQWCVNMRTKAWSVFGYTHAASCNVSYDTFCAEDDNVNISLSGNISRFTVIATHPAAYPVTDFTCAPNFNNCGPSTNIDYSFETFTQKTDFPGGYVIANRYGTFWRPQGMTFTVNGLSPRTDIHLLQIGKHIPGTDEWPQFFVLYSDGYMRLIPFPPPGYPAVCFGSSVIVGPAAPARRPHADIAAADLRTSSRPYTLLLTYRSGGSATLDFENVTRDSDSVNVLVDYPPNESFCTFRSMFADEGNSDCDHVWWRDISGFVHNDPVRSYSGGAGREWFFHRMTKSMHNQSAPDIRVILD